MLALLLLVALVGWLLYHFLVSLPLVDAAADRAYLRHKTVWITGASSGIGKALAEYLIGVSGVRVILSARNEASLEAVASSLRAGGADVLVLPLDLVALADDATLASQAVTRVAQRFPGAAGSVDVLIHNAGCSMRGAVANTKLDVDVQLMKCNVVGAMALTKAVLPAMLARGSGHIVAMSSVQGKLPLAYRSSYSASKHAMNGYFHSLRLEVAPRGLGVHVICPGYVRTNISLNALRSDGGRHGVMDATTAGGYAPEYIAALTYAAVRGGVAEAVPADVVARAGIMLYAIAPAVLSHLMVSRAEKERAKMEAEEKKEEAQQQRGK